MIDRRVVPHWPMAEANVTPRNEDAFLVRVAADFCDGMTSDFASLRARFVPDTSRCLTAVLAFRPMPRVKKGRAAWRKLVRAQSS